MVWSRASRRVGAAVALAACGWAPTGRAQPVARFGELPANAPDSAPKTPPPPPPSASSGDAGPARKPIWSSALVTELYRRAQQHERRGDAAQAVGEYLDAIRVDPTFGPALLALARLRQAMGDPDEAEQLCARAARLPPYAAQAFALRAQLRRERGRIDEALSDLQAAAEREPSIARLQALADAYVEQQSWPAALAVWRRILGRLESSPGSPELAAARVKVRALSALAGDADPVASGDASQSWVRRALSRIAERTQ